MVIFEPGDKERKLQSKLCKANRSTKSHSLALVSLWPIGQWPFHEINNKK